MTGFSLAVNPGLEWSAHKPLLDLTPRRLVPHPKLLGTLLSVSRFDECGNLIGTADLAQGPEPVRAVAIHSAGVSRIVYD